eukprot:TRINITY_DN1699_c0_g1_i1.p2 TRINITY_DN1699_c0_g1~~TRINITY_DN1699_c0_g1_i1.p2  ORF type:complete len:157 (-),score=6.07 TRINITY_DN1699_c0_g1_i1:166-636(-)
MVRTGYTEPRSPHAHSAGRVEPAGGQAVRVHYHGATWTEEPSATMDVRLAPQEMEYSPYGGNKPQARHLYSHQHGLNTLLGPASGTGFLFSRADERQRGPVCVKSDWERYNRRRVAEPTGRGTTGRLMKIKQRPQIREPAVPRKKFDLDAYYMGCW